MSFSLVNNLASLDSQSRLSATSAKLNRTLQRLSSGLRINNSGDDAAGLAIANVFRNDIAKLSQGIRNANDGVSTLQIIDGGLATISTLLDRAMTLATQAASDTFTGDRATLQQEFSKILAEIDRQAQNIGLGGPNNTPEGRFSKDIRVFIGGGTTATSSNNEVIISLNNVRVDTSASGLNLQGQDISAAGAGTPYTGPNVPAAGLTNDEVLTFTIDGNTYTVNLASGDDALDIAAKINANQALRNAGISASASSPTSGITLSTTLKNFTVVSDQGASSEVVASASPVSVTAGSATAGAKAAITAIQSALTVLGQVQGKVGAGQNNLAQAIDLATSQVTNFQAAESRIRDADIAAEASDLSRLTILQQAGVAALAQANQSNQAVLSLLR